MDGAEVIVRASSARSDAELLVRIQCGRFLELLFHADNGVRFFVAIDPGDLLARFHRYRLWIEGEVFDLDLVFTSGRTRDRQFSAGRSRRKGKKSNAAEKRCCFVYR